MNANEFLQLVRDNRLAPTDELEEVADGLTGSGSVSSLAGALTAVGLLTPFQVKKILAGEVKQLLLGQYRLLDELGRGGMGQVFKAFHTVMGRTVAVKVLAPDLQGDEPTLKLFAREVRTITQLQHPNIVLAYDANEVHGLHFLVMEYVEGQNLQTLVKKQGPLPVAQACAMMFQAALALQYAHDMGLVHRDIKPANLLVPVAPRAETAPAFLDAAADGAQDLHQRPPLVKIVDFGLARLRNTKASETIQLDFAGTPDFVSPEQCDNVHGVDIRSDLYSLGCTFYFALTGHVPFERDSVMAKLTSHLKDAPPPIRQLRPAVPPEVEAVVLKLMAKDPNDRFQTPRAVARALQPWCAPQGGMAAPNGTALKPVQPPPTTNLGSDTPRPAENRLLSDCLPAIQGSSLADAPDTAEFEGPAAEAASLPEYANTRVVAFDSDKSASDSGSFTGLVLPSGVEFGLKKDAVAPGRALKPVPTAPPTVARPTAAASPGDAAANKSAAGNAVVVDSALRHSWRLWTDLIAAIHAGQGSGDWDGTRYHQLYGGLIARCRHEAGAGTAERRAFFRQLEEVVKPWISLEILGQTEPELRASLLVQCRRVEEILGVRRTWEQLGSWVRLLAGTALVVWMAAQLGLGLWSYWSAKAAGPARLDWHTALSYLHLDSFTGLAWVGMPVVFLAAVIVLFPRR